jgi:microcystin-dependent protein
MGVVVLPKSLTAKTEAKAADVMANFNAIVTQVNGKLDLENLAESLRVALIPTGSILATARAAAPTGFLLCQGQAVSRTTYAVLFAAIGTAFGAGDGVTTFNLPDLRGRVPMGVDGGVNRLTIQGNSLGKSGGDQNMAKHSHANGGGTSIESVNHTHNLGWFAGNRHEGEGFTYQGVSAGGNTNTGGVSAFHTHVLTGRTQDEGSGGAGNLVPYQVVNWMIKI